ncbi:MAG: hypothetical protein NVS2B17_19210 [Candidatus Velthaea sp.]
MLSDPENVPVWSTPLTEAIPALVWVTSADGSLTEYANVRWSQYTGVDITEPFTGSVFLVSHPDDHAMMLATWDAVRDGSAPFRCEYRIRRVDGEYRWHDVHAVPVRNAEGELSQWFGIAIDVEERRQSAEMFRRLTESLPQLVWVSRVDGSVEYWNEQFYAYLGIDDRSREPMADWSPIAHPDDLAAVTAAWTWALESGTAFEHELRMRRCDGVYRWFLARAAPVTFENGVPTLFVGSATDIDQQKRSRLAFEFLDQVSDIMGSALEGRDMLQRVADATVPDIADWCAIYVQRGDDTVEPAAIAHVNPNLVEAGWALARQYPVPAHDPSIAVMKTGKSMLVPSIPPEMIAATARDERHLDALKRFSFRSAIAVPLVGRGRNLGYMQFFNGESPRQFDESDLRLAEILGKRVGISVENAQIYERERKISDTFQNAALARSLPHVEGLTLTAVYMAAERDAEVGGDWYDAFLLPDGRLALSVGDVGGKGLSGAVLMASMRHGIRILAQQGFSPGRILLAVSHALEQEHPESIATAFVATIDPRSWTMQYAVAGHPAPALRRPDGSVTLLPVKAAPPLGVLTSEPEGSTLHAIPPRSLLVIYTDGLIESTHDLDIGETRVKAAMASEAVLHSADPASLITDTVLFDGSQDDVAVLTVAFGRSTRWAFDARDAMAAHGARADLMKVLYADGDPASEFGDAELIFGELIGNVVRHAPGAIDVALAWDDDAPVLHVIDRGPGFTREAALPDMLSESGRGLFIISSIAGALHYERLAGRGTHVVATLPVKRRRGS